MLGGTGNSEDEGDECDECDAITTASLRRWPATKLESFDLGTSDVKRMVMMGMWMQMSRMKYSKPMMD
jgi:hypothetical protein